MDGPIEINPAVSKDGKLHSLDKDDLEDIFKTYKDWAKKGHMAKAKKGKKKKK